MKRQCRYLTARRAMPMLVCIYKCNVMSTCMKTNSNQTMLYYSLLFFMGSLKRRLFFSIWILCFVCLLCCVMGNVWAFEWLCLCVRTQRLADLEPLAVLCFRNTWIYTKIKERRMFDVCILAACAQNIEPRELYRWFLHFSFVASFYGKNMFVLHTFAY